MAKKKKNEKKSKGESKKDADDRTTAPPPARDDEPTGRVDVRLGNRIEASRDVVIEAVYLEALERGMNERWALAAAEDVADRLRLGGECGEAGIELEQIGDVPFYDLRNEQDYLYPGGKGKARMRAPGVPVLRDMSKIDMVVLHQTAVEFGVSKHAIRQADGDVELARARRALDVACHAMAFRAGYFVAAHDLDVYVNHANRFNLTSFGLEIDGRYPGLLDDHSTVAREDLDTTWGGEPTELTNDTVNAACAALTWLVTEGRKLGAPVTKIVSHRQSSDSRRADPGEEIWQRVAIDFGAEELGLEVVCESPWNQGRPVPVEWDEGQGIGPY